MGTAPHSYNAFDEIDADILQALFIDDTEAREYADKKAQKSEIDSDGEFAVQCTTAAQRQ